MKCLLYEFVSETNPGNEIRVARLVDEFDFEKDFAWGERYARALDGFNKEFKISGIRFVDNRKLTGL